MYKSSEQQLNQIIQETSREERDNSQTAELIKEAKRLHELRVMFSTLIIRTTFQSVLNTCLSLESGSIWKMSNDSTDM